MTPTTKPVLPPLQTPKSCTFPSEIQSGPLSAIGNIKQEDAASTPITPPLAYTEFLKALTPVFSPVSPGVSFSKYPAEKYNFTGSVSQPTTATTTSFSSSDTKPPTISPKSSSMAKSPIMKSPVVPLSAKSANGKRRMRLPPVKTSFKSFSPTSASPMSATTLRSPFSPADWKLRYIETPRSACGKPVSVKQVVTRTVTYKRTPLDPPPKGKRRKTTED